MLSLKKMALGAGVLLSAVSFSPLALAGSGGLAGSAAFDATSGGGINGVGVASAIGKNGAGAWALNDANGANPSLNSAGAIGSSGVTTFAGPGFTASSVGSVAISSLTNADQLNNVTQGPDISLQTTSNGIIVNIP